MTTPHLARTLITEQFPQYASLPITPVSHPGNDNTTFRLGEKLLIRMPNAPDYAKQVIKEQTWLPHLLPNLSLRIPTPVAQGAPTHQYPYHWSIYHWIEGESLNTLSLDAHEQKKTARNLATFIRELDQIDTTGAPVPGTHNYHRGASLHIYNEEMLNALTQLRDSIDTNKAAALWRLALESNWQNPPVWIHGDLAPGNILMQNNTLSAIIDFGLMAIGDPACDLTIAWTLLDTSARKIFKQEVARDLATWDRARGWSIWKACIELTKNPVDNYWQTVLHKTLAC